MTPLRCLALLAALLLPGGHSLAAEPRPLADIHIHYKWNQKDTTPARKAADILAEHHIELAVVIGTPPALALELAQLAPQRIIPIWSPYRDSGEWSRWAFDQEVPQRAREALASGRYHGIGELHLIGGFTPDWNTPVIRALLELGAEFEVPVMLHTEFSRNDYLLGLCRAHPQTRILWAHAGAILEPAAVDAVLAACPNVWAELSARDPWRYVRHPITAADGALLPEWEALIRRYPDRFMVGSDPVWPVDQLDGWDQDDTGWDEYGRFIDFHRGWIGRLDPALGQKLRLDNARRLFDTRSTDDD
ncbi:MAG: hypothetical protein CMN57_01950 [Gammaproteobacteria bacterium]|nr:hypothetical protein [Gammaproteobacteria bacterium]